jgi:hypothetical protein
MAAWWPRVSRWRLGKMIRPVDRDHRALDLVGETSVVIEPLRLVCAAISENQFAIVPDLDLTEVFGVLLDELGDPPRHFHPPAQMDHRLFHAALNPFLGHAFDVGLCVGLGGHGHGHGRLEPALASA